MKLNFDAMTKEELKTYVLRHKNDIEAFNKLADRLKADNQDSPWYPYPDTPEEILLMQKAIGEKIKSMGD